MGRKKTAGERIIESLQEFADKLQRGAPIFGTRVNADGAQRRVLVIPPKSPSERTYAARRRKKRHD